MGPPQGGGARGMGRGDAMGAGGGMGRGDMMGGGRMGGGGGAMIQTGSASRLSPHETISANVSMQYVVSITYGRPYKTHPQTGEVRVVGWGSNDFVPNPWRLGADEATILLSPVALRFGDVTVPAGAHTLYMAFQDNGPAQLVFSSRVGKWGIPVDTANDVARVNLTQAALSPAKDQLELAFDNNDDGSLTLKIMWDTRQYSANFNLAP